MRPTLLYLNPIALLALTTWLFHAFPWDLEASGAYYDPESNTWHQRNAFPWRGLYDLGQHPALFTAFFGLVGFVISFFVPSLKPFRRRFIYVCLVMVIGPGLVINAIFKDYWGRPRPRDVKAFDGVYAYEKVLTIDPSSPGKSFPSGHASMGFFFMCFFFVFKKRSWRIAALLFGLAFGAIMGWARIVQGGHFASDVIFSAGMVFLTAAALAYLLKLDREIKATPSSL
jgi:lipid A 4'-phosphatase